MRVSTGMDYVDIADVCKAMGMTERELCRRMVAQRATAMTEGER